MYADTEFPVGWQTPSVAQTRVSRRFEERRDASGWRTLLVGCLPNSPQRLLTRKYQASSNSHKRTYNGHRTENRRPHYAFKPRKPPVSLICSAVVTRCLTVSNPALFCSKEGSAQVKLKLGLSDDEAGHTFLFISPQAFAERESFKKELTNIIGANRAVQAVTPSTAPSTPANYASRSHAGPTPNTAPGSRAASVASSGRDSPAAVGTPEDFAVRKKVLMKNAELASLHRELVMSGQITEVEFWEGREVSCFVELLPRTVAETKGMCFQHMLEAEMAQDNQRRGRPGQLVDPRPETVDGDIKIRVTPQLVHDIFEEYPVVARAYNDNVPKQVNSTPEL